MRQFVTLDKHTPLKGALNFSWLLDAPAGKHGFVQVKDGHLWFEDGTRALFLGMDFPVRSLLCDHESSEILAEKMAGLGVNVIRVHAIDVYPSNGGWATEPDLPFIEYRAGNSRSLNPEALERLDYFVWQLKKRGIYVHMDLNVARKYMPGDELDYNTDPIGGKMLGMMNRRIIELQKEYATQLLTHVNEYTGLAYIADPAVMTVQITNEDTITLYGASSTKENPTPYAEELKRRFNWFLLSKYGSGKHLREAWTHEGVCALLDGEDAEKGTVEMPYDERWRMVCDLSGDYRGEESPVRHADFMDFCISITRDYYRELMNHIRALGAKMPVACSNLVHGAPEVYAMSDADVMENNAYWNHPTYGEIYTIKNPREYISSDPREFCAMDYDRPVAGHITTQLAQGVISGKPFVATEWNEYGSMQYHSASFLMTAAYACLQDWDGLILYTYFTRGKSAFDQAEDYVENIMESYSDPSLICQHGIMATIFLKRLFKPAKSLAEVCWTMNDSRTFSVGFGMASSYLPYVCRMGNVYMNDDHYRGNADVAISGGGTATGDFREAKHAFVWNEIPYADAARHSYRGRAYSDSQRLPDARDLMEIGTIDEHAVVIDDGQALLDPKRWDLFSRALDAGMKEWGILPEGTGLQDGGRAIVSETGELTFAAADVKFTGTSDRIAIFAGKATGVLTVGPFDVEIRNNRMTFSALPLDGDMQTAKRFVVTAMGESGNDGMHYEGEENYVIMDGKLSIDAWEGSLAVSGDAELYALGMYGERIAQIPGVKQGEQTRFEMTGEYPAANFEIVLK